MPEQTPEISSETNKIIPIIIIVAIIALGGYFLFKREQPSPTMPQAPEQPAIPELSSQPSAEVTSMTTEKVITYTDTGYSPNTLTIKNEEIVTFKNQSVKSMWPASAMHPTHQEYPTIGGCFGSTFDACKGFLPGESWSFKFDKTGTWKYHDHLNPSNFGTIIVQ
ncbi:MAG TPA: hypothetical protein VJC04_02910 [Candidatus Paceibacterota bacterium]